MNTEHITIIEDFRDESYEVPWSVMNTEQDLGKMNIKQDLGKMNTKQDLKHTELEERTKLSIKIKHVQD